jgi:hypothetical protein
MVSKEMIKSEIEKVPEQSLEELYEVVKLYSRPAVATNGGTLFSKLRKIEIDGPEDFSVNIDLYLSGEKSIG